jgi:hypothetical protein
MAEVIYTTPTKDLDVISKYKALLAESLGSDSVYIRTKETYETLAASGDLKDADKAKILAETLSSMNGSLANSCMQAALSWASTEKDLEFKKVELAKQLAIMDADKALKDAQIEKLKYDSIAVQAQTLRTMGAPTVIDGKVTSLLAEGTMHQDILVGVAQVTKIGKENTLLDSRLDESFAAIHKLVADTVVNFGSWSYTLAKTGVTGAGRTVTGTPIQPLSDIQLILAKEQAKGYTYNAWSNAVTASAGMVGTALASDGATDLQPVVDDFKLYLNRLGDNAVLPASLL